MPTVIKNSLIIFEIARWMQSWLCFSNLNINLSFGVSLNEISFASNKINTARRSIIKEKFNIKLKSSFYTEFRIREFFQFFFFFNQLWSSFSERNNICPRICRSNQGKFIFRFYCSSLRQSESCILYWILSRSID